VQGLPDDDGNEPLLLQLLREHARNMQLQQQLAAPAAAAVAASNVSKPLQQLSTVSSGPVAASIGQQQQQPVSKSSSTLDTDFNGACLQSAEDEDYDAVFVRLSYIEGPKHQIIHMRIAKLCAAMPVVAHTSEPIIKASGLHTSRLCSLLGKETIATHQSAVTGCDFRNLGLLTTIVC